MGFTNKVLFFIRASTLLSTISVVKVVNGQIELSAGSIHTCAFERTSAELKCWGYNGSYQLNTGNEDNQYSPIGVSLLPETYDAEGGMAGGIATCMIAKDVSTVSCVGSNENGQLGNGGTTDPVTTPTNVILPVDVKVAKFVIGWHSCMISDQKELFCTGNNDYGQLGMGDTTNRLVPEHVTGGYKAEMVAVGVSYTCFADGVFALLCMGWNEYGQLGTGTSGNKLIPVAIDLGDRTVKELTCGYYHTCIITDLAMVLCTGYNVNGQLGDGSNSDKNVLTPLSQQEDDAIALAAEGFHTCFTVINNKVFCMGLNDYGQLGNGGTTNSNIPVEVDMPASVTPMELALGYYHSCVSTTTNKVYCWGRGIFGQLGYGSTSDQSTPTLVQGIDWPVPPPTSFPSLPPSEYPGELPSLSPSLAPVSTCSDRTGEWKIGRKTKNWCSWAKGQGNTIKACKTKDLHKDCPETCGVCSSSAPSSNTSTPAPVFLPTLAPAANPTCSCEAMQNEVNRISSIETEVNVISQQIEDINNKIEDIDSNIENIGNKIERILDILE